MVLCEQRPHLGFTAWSDPGLILKIRPFRFVHVEPKSTKYLKPPVAKVWLAWQAPGIDKLTGPKGICGHFHSEALEYLIHRR